MQTDIARARHRSPAAILLEDEQHVVQQINGFQVQQERRIPMLLQNHSRRDRGFETVRLVSFNHLAKRPHRPTVTFPVIRQGAEKRCTFAGVLSRCTSAHSFAVKDPLSGRVIFINKSDFVRNVYKAEPALA